MFNMQWAPEGLSCVLAGADYNLRGQEDPMAYEKALQAMRQALKEEVEVVYAAHQTHSARVVRVDGRSAPEYYGSQQFEETDGLLTTQKGQALLVKFADCTPIVLFDPKKKAVAAVHSGWRGTRQRISQVAVDLLKKEVGSEAKDLLAYIGPCIDPKVYEVDEPVYEAFADCSSRDRFLTPRAEKGKYLLNMPLANAILLEEAGLQKCHITSEPIHTFTDPRLHSARKEGKGYGLNGLLVQLV